TFDSAPPTVAWNRSASASSSPRGGESRSIASPSATTSAGCADKEPDRRGAARAEPRSGEAADARRAPRSQPAAGVVEGDAERQEDGVHGPVAGVEVPLVVHADGLDREDEGPGGEVERERAAAAPHEVAERAGED